MMRYDIYCNDCKKIFKSDLINTNCPTCKNYNTGIYKKGDKLDGGIEHCGELSTILNMSCNCLNCIKKRKADEKSRDIMDSIDNCKIKTNNTDLNVPEKRVYKAVEDIFLNSSLDRVRFVTILLMVVNKYKIKKVKK